MQLSAAKAADALHCTLFLTLCIQFRLNCLCDCCLLLSLLLRSAELSLIPAAMYAVQAWLFVVSAGASLCFCAGFSDKWVVHSML